MSDDVMKGESGLDIADEMYVHEWMSNGYKVGKAYLKIFPGVSKQTAGTNGAAKLKEPLVAAYASGVIKSHLDKYNVTEESIIGELANIAFLDPVKLVDKDGLIDKIQDIPEEARRCIASMTEDVNGKFTVKLCNKEKALELLAKYKKLLTEMHEISGDKDLATEIIAGRQRAGLLTKLADLLL